MKYGLASLIVLAGLAVSGCETYSDDWEPAPQPAYSPTYYAAPARDTTPDQIRQLQNQISSLSAQLDDMRRVDALTAEEVRRLKARTCELGKIVSRLEFRRGADTRLQLSVRPEPLTPPAEYCT